MPRSSPVAPWLAALAAIAYPVFGASGDDPRTTELRGLWRAELEHAGSTSEMELEIVARPGEPPAGLLTLPAIDLRDLELGPVRTDGDAVSVGLLTLTWDRDSGTLSGVLPSQLVPVVSIPFELRRVADARQAADRPPPVAAPSVEPLWSRDIGAAVWAGLAASEGMVFVGDDDGALSALDARDGRRLWRSRTGGRIRARPVVHNAAVLVHSDDGSLYAFRQQTGEELWKVSIGPPSARLAIGERGSRYEHFASSPTPTEDRIYVANADGELLCLEPTTREILWRFRAGDVITSTPAVADGRVFVGSFDHHVYAVDAASGRLIWQRDTGAALPASPVVAGGLVIVGGRSYELLALDAETGKTVWSRYFWFTWVEADPALAGDVVYAGLSDGQNLVALDAGTGAELWRFDTGGSVWSRPAIGPGTLTVAAVGVPKYFVDHRAGIFTLDLSGSELWRHQPREPSAAGGPWGFAASPIAHSGRVYAVTLEGRMLAFPLPGGD